MFTASIYTYLYPEGRRDWDKHTDATNLGSHLPMSRWGASLHAASSSKRFPVDQCWDVDVWSRNELSVVSFYNPAGCQTKM